MTEDENKLEYERQLATLPPMVAGMIESMREQINEMEFIMAWALAQLDHLPGVQPHHALRFLSGRANYLERVPDEGFDLSPEDAQARLENEGKVEQLDYLRELVQEWHRFRKSKQ